jgi:hypothetical protein
MLRMKCGCFTICVMNKGIKCDLHSTDIFGFMNKGAIWIVDKSYVVDLLAQKMNIWGRLGLPLPGEGLRVRF